jgi:hypothetical protein
MRVECRPFSLCETEWLSERWSLHIFVCVFHDGALAASQPHSYGPGLIGHDYKNPIPFLCAIGPRYEQQYSRDASISPRLQ